MELLAKLTDAASMFWQALDERERLLVLYGAAWFLLALVATAQRRSRQELRDSILEELEQRAERRSG